MFTSTQTTCITSIAVLRNLVRKRANNSSEDNLNNDEGQNFYARVRPAAKIKLELKVSLPETSGPTVRRLTSPVVSSVNSPTSATQNGGYPTKITGVPCPATPTRYTAPVHIDVGGVIYTSSLETLTR